MTGEFFELLEDMSLPRRWVFTRFKDVAGKEVARWDFYWGRPVTWTTPISIEHKGDVQMDVGFNTSKILIASVRAANVFRRLAPDSMQLFPVSVVGSNDEYFIVNIITRIACLDEKLSHVERWSPKNPVRPDLAGQVSTLLDLHIESERASGKHMFKLDEDPLHLIVSKTLKEALEEAKITGVKYQDVTSPKIADFRLKFAERQKNTLRHSFQTHYFWTPIQY